VAQPGGDLEACTTQTERAVGTACTARDFDAERIAQHGRVGALARHRGTGQVVRQRRDLELGMHCAVVLLLDPGLGRLVEQLQREGLLALEHGHQPAFHAAPERFLFRVLV